MMPAVRCTAEILLGLLGLDCRDARDRCNGGLERPRFSTQTASDAFEIPLDMGEDL